MQKVGKYYTLLLSSTLKMIHNSHIQRVLIINDNGDDAFSTPFKSLIDENLWSWLCFLKCYDLGFCSDPSPPLCLHVFTRYFIERDFKTKGFIKTKAPAGHSWWKYKTKRKEERTPLKTEEKWDTIKCTDFFFATRQKTSKPSIAQNSTL